MRSFNFNNLDRIDLENVFVFSDLEYFLKFSNNYEEIILDLTNINWFNSCLTSIFIAIVNKYKEEKNIKISIKADKNIQKVLKVNGIYDKERTIRNNFFERFLSGDIYDTYIPIKDFKKNNENYFLEYVNKNLKNRHFTNNCLEEIISNLLEVYGNFSSHSGSEFFYFSGQFFPNKKTINICLTDKGVGLSKYIMSKMSNLRTQKEAIEWAFEYGNTTREEAIFGGVGLKILKKFIENKKGRISIYCNNSYYDILNRKYKEYNNEFLGTSIIIELPNNC